MRLSDITTVAVVLISFCCFSSTSAFAAGPYYCDTVLCRTVVSSVDYLRSVNTTAIPYDDKISITCYHEPIGPEAICAGGGDFDRVLYVSGVGACPNNHTLDNGATIIQDMHGNCFFRKNFGVNGVVDARQCGLWADSLPFHTVNSVTYYDATLLNTCMNVASQNSYAIVSTGGGTIVDNTTPISIPDNVTLSCAGTSIANAQARDYRIASAGGMLTKAIVLDPTHDNGTGVATGYTIVLNGRNSALTDCTIEAGAGAFDTNTNSYPNPYSPSIWYPDCRPDVALTVPCATDATPTAHFRSAVLEQKAFTNMPIFPSGAGVPALTRGPAETSIGITVTGPQATVRNVSVVGFGICLELGFQTTGAGSPSIEHFQGDCGSGIRAITSDAPAFSDVSLGPALTTDEIGFQITNNGISWPMGGSAYQVSIDTSGSDFVPSPGDTFWITPQVGKGAESAAGYWTIGSDATCSGSICTFSLVGSQKTVTLGGGAGTSSPLIQIRSVMSDGIPASAITGISPVDPSFKFVQLGQNVTSGSCFSGAKVTSIWPGSGTIYVSAPSSCDMTGAAIVFSDNLPYSGQQTDDNCITDNADLDPAALTGCALVDSNFRWGDGIHIENSGGAFFTNCHVFEYLVSYHMYDGTRTADFTNCATGNHNDLPDRNLSALNSVTYPSGNVISLLINGSHHHVPPEQTNETDACETNWANNVFGQHRSVDIVVQSDCDTQNRIINASIGAGSANFPGTNLELDAGGVSLVNGEGGGASPLFVAQAAPLYYYDSSTSTFIEEGTFPAKLKISNNRLEKSELILQNNEAAASTSGCGNSFAHTTPFLCAPSSFVQAPGGRLTLKPCDSGGCYPVMTADVSGATSIYYVPYTGQQIPIYNSATGAFGLVDSLQSGTSELTYTLFNTTHSANLLYDVFAENIGGPIELCTGPGWSSSPGATRPSANNLTQINGIWVNAVEMTCNYNHTSTRDCQPSSCTYLGTFYATAAGQTAQQFGPNTLASGNGNCLCLYNAYNHATLTSASSDSNATYAYSSSTWRLMDSTAGTINSINIVDGLAQMQLSAELTDLLKNVTRTAAIGISVDTATVPTPIVQSNSSTAGTYNAALTATPKFGLRSIQAVESAIGTGGASNAMFGGTGYQRLSVQVAD